MEPYQLHYIQQSLLHQKFSSDLKNHIRPLVDRVVKKCSALFHLSTEYCPKSPTQQKGPLEVISIQCNGLILLTIYFASTTLYTKHTTMGYWAKISNNGCPFVFGMIYFYFLAGSTCHFFTHPQIGVGGRGLSGC